MRDFGADYRLAKAAVPAHVQAWADAEQAVHAWLRARRGVPAHELYDRQTGQALDPELAELEAAVVKAKADSEWCRALVIACGEKVKGRKFAEIIAAQARRPSSSPKERN